MNITTEVGQFKYDDHTSIPFKFVELKPAKEDLKETPHRHNFFQIFFFTQSGGSHLIDFDKFSVKKSSVHIVNPGNIHSLTRTEKTAGYVLLFSRAFYDQNNLDSSLFLYRNDFTKVLHFQESSFQALIDLVQKIGEEWYSSEKLKQSAIQSLLQFLIINIQRNIIFESDNSDNKSSIIKQLNSLINQHFDKEHSVEFYSNKLSITTEKLGQLVKEHYQKTTSELIQNRIILEAKRLLFHSNKNVKEIAFALGYNDPSYFTRIFKAKAKQTPLDFRKTIREMYR